MGGQGLEVERPQQQGRGQLLHGFDEHQHGTGKEAASHQGQMHPAQHTPRPLPQGAGRHVEAGGDLAHAALHRADGDGHEAHQVAEYDGGKGAGQQQAGPLHPEPLGQIVETKIERRQRYQHPDGQHCARHGIAGGGDAQGQQAAGAAIEAAEEAEQQGDGHGEQGSQGRDEQTVASETHEFRRPRQLEVAHPVVQQDHERQAETGQHQPPAPEPGQQTAGPLEGVAQGLLMAHRLLEHLLTLAGAALQGDEQHHSQQHQAGEPCGCGQAAIAEPGVVNGRRQGVDGKEVDCGEVRQCLHRHQRRPHHDGRTGQGQAEATKALPGGAAEQSAGVNEADRLFQEGGARQQIDIGEEHQRQHPGGTAEGADGREPVIGRALPVKQGSQPRLQRARVVEQVGIDVSHYVGGHGHGQHQRPLQGAAPRHLAHGDQPGGGHPEQQAEQHYPQHQP
ncbi:hypothetical protein D3C78_619800 [compost metagenome]